MEHWRSRETENKIPKFIPNTDGCEVLTNDGELKVVLRKSTSFAGEMEQSAYVAVYYIKEGDGWLKTETTKSFVSMREFISELRGTEEFWQAMRDYDDYGADA
jgi:hypothetical protein